MVVSMPHRCRLATVTPAKAGVQLVITWIPACAGMTFYDVFSTGLLGCRVAKLISGRTFKTLPRETLTVPVFTPRGFETSRARLQWTETVDA